MTKLLTLIAMSCLFPLAAHADDDRELPNCAVATALPCFEVVWVEGAPFEMAFYDLDVTTGPPTQSFYVVAPQSGVPQGTIPFLHDHVVGDDDGRYWHGYLVMCSPQGLSSGACVAAEESPSLARTVNGQTLRTTAAIEAAANAGLVVLVDTGAVMRASVRHCGHRHHR